ncbi:hypothetical protein BC941DRAFT_470561 [Chlamydoabsidia padenii]|nr:hypothetical protein BC941DRAFT_470561 [Chlamydoabsidia padenii]
MPLFSTHCNCYTSLGVTNDGFFFFMVQLIFGYIGSTKEAIGVVMRGYSTINLRAHDDTIWQNRHQSPTPTNLFGSNTSPVLPAPTLTLGETVHRSPLLQKSETTHLPPTNNNLSITKSSPSSNDSTKTAQSDDGVSVYPIPNLEQLQKLEPKERFFEGNLIYIHNDVGLPPEFRTCLTQQLEKAGAIVTNREKDTTGKDSVIYIFRHRDSELFMEKCKQGKMVASLAWLTNTLRRGYVESPLRSIWDFPSPKGGIPGMENMVATITGYEGEARTLVFQLCTMIGLKWTPTLGNDTTHLICSRRGSSKYKIGRQRDCYIINHLWLEECYQQWENKPLDDERYSYYPENNVMQKLIGKTPLGTMDLEKWYDKDTLPSVTPYIPAYLLRKTPSRTDTPLDLEGILLSKRPRQAALDAYSQLRDKVIPDMNSFQQEQRLKVKHPSTITTPTDSAPLSTCGKQPRLPFVTMSSKRIKVQDNGSTSPINDSAGSIKNIATTSCNLTKEEEKEMRNLGGKIVNDIQKADVLVVPNRMLRTPKFLCAVNLGITITTYQWLKDSIDHQSWRPASAYQVTDTEMEHKHGFKLGDSLLRARATMDGARGTWLRGYDVYVLQTDQDNPLKGVVESAGGNFIPVPNRRSFSEEMIKDNGNTVLVLASKDRKRTWWADLKERGIGIYDQDLVIVGSLRQQLALDEFKIG